MAEPDPDALKEALALAIGIIGIRVREPDIWAFDGTYLGDAARDEADRVMEEARDWQRRVARRLGVDPKTLEAGVTAAHCLGYDLQQDMAPWAVDLLRERKVRLPPNMTPV